MDNFTTRKSAWEENKNICVNDFRFKHKIIPSIKYNYDDLNKNPIYDMSKGHSIAADGQLDKTYVYVLPKDTLECGLNLKNNGYNPVVLNMADPCFAGGGVNMGCGAQEESLFYRTNYFQTLNNNTGFYPISDASGIYSRDVFVIRDKDLKLINKHENISFIAVAAIKDPQINNDSHFTNDQSDLTKKKIELIFQIAMKENHDSIVVSALGCGAFHNPPNDIIDIFNEAIKKYKYYFKLITFAILPLSITGSRYMLKEDRKCNYELFKDKISTNIY